MSGTMMADPNAMAGGEIADPAAAMGMNPFADVMAMAAADPTAAPRMMRRDTPEPGEARRKLVAEVQSDVEMSKQHWAPEFDRMREWARMVRYGGGKDWAEASLYVANILQAHVDARTARLYARNPRMRVDRKKTMDFALWDGSVQTLQAASMDPANPASAPLVRDVMQGGLRRRMMDGVARTLQLVAEHEIQQVRPLFKKQMKGLVARAVVRGVGYVKIGFERHMKPSPETMERTSNLEVRLAHIERLLSDIHDPEAAAADPMSREAEELRLAIQNVQNQEMIVSDEGLRFDFPRSTAIIPDRGLRDLHGFIGCDRVTEEFVWSVQQIQEMFGVDVRGPGTCYYNDKAGSAAKPVLSPAEPGADVAETSKVMVWCTYDRKVGVVYWSVKGYPDFLSEPAPPPITLVRFWPWFALTFTHVEENEDEPGVSPFPLSDIERLRCMQDEHNRSRQGLRDHRIAARPKAAIPEGALEDEDEERLTKADAHSVVRLRNVAPGQKIEDILQWIKHPGIDPAMYDTAHLLQDAGRVTNSQASDVGAVAGVTATEVARAANTGDQNSESAVDDLNVLLSELFTEAGRVLLMEMDPGTVKKIAGDGAVWPTIPTPDIFDGLYLTIQGGSTGRPNRAADVQAIQTLAPILLQVPGVSPKWLAEEVIRRLDDTIDIEDAILEGLPSIMAMARMAQGPAGQPGAPGEHPGADKGPSDPAATANGAAGGGETGQGGAMNAPAPPGAVFGGPANPATEPSTVVSGRGGVAQMNRMAAARGPGALFAG